MNPTGLGPWIADWAWSCPDCPDCGVSCKRVGTGRHPLSSHEKQEVIC
jgi:hypothetical protein